MMVKFEQVEAYCRRREKGNKDTLIELSIVDSILITSICTEKRTTSLQRTNNKVKFIRIYNIIIIIPNMSFIQRFHCYSTD